MSEPHLHHIPQFHIRLPRGFLNDPNGPVEIDGEFHLYFQSRPFADMDVPVEWGHATSRDLVHWTLHRPAISPLPGGPDTFGCWSGNTVIHDGRVRAYYSGKLNTSIYQSVLMSESDDGNTFGEPTQVVEDPSPEEGISMFRDPFVWKDVKGWGMAVGVAGPRETAAIRGYRSNDGIQWKHDGDLASLRRTVLEGEDTGEGWECPQIMNVDGRPVAIVSSWSHLSGPAKVLAFALDRTPEPRSVDDGQNFYAASVMGDSSRGPVIFGWITEGRDDAWWKEAGWAGAIALPRRAWLDGHRFASEPHPVLGSLRAGDGRPADGAIINAQAEIAVFETDGRVRLCFGKEEHVDISLDSHAGTVTIDRNSASSDPRAHAGLATAADAFDSTADRPSIRVFIDGSVIEVFTSSGRTLTSRVYPTATPPWRVEAPQGSQLWDLRKTISSSSSGTPSAVSALTPA